jgi:PST family polysaccharide transporter
LTEPAPAATPDIGRKTFRAAAWAFFSATGKRVLTLIGLTLLARVLAPKDFGLVGFAMVYLTFIEVVGDLGAASALVYWPDRREDAAQVTFVVNVIAGVFWFVVSLAAAPWVADFFHEPRVTEVVRVLAVTTLIKFLGNTHDALAQKDLRFSARSIPELTLTAIKTAAALVLAFLGFGAWSLVWGQIAGLVCWTILLWIVVPWRPSRHIPADLFKPMLLYGRNIVAVQMLATVMFYVDSIAVGRFLGRTALGLYEMASRVPDSSVLVLIWVAAQALFPAFSKLHAEGGDVRGAYLVATRCVSSLTLPASLGLFFLARPIILVFFGPQWAGAAPILSILALYVGFRGVDEVGNVLKATGRTHTLVWLTVIKTVLLVPAVIVGARYSATAVAAALAIVYGTGTVITTIIAARIIDVPFRSILGAFSRSAQAAAVMSVALFAWMRWTTPLGNVSQLFGGVLLGAAIYVATLRLLDRQIFEWMRMVLTKKPGASDDLLRQVTGAPEDTAA